jgi:hypothetical protein
MGGKVNEVLRSFKEIMSSSKNARITVGGALSLDIFLNFDL